MVLFKNATIFVSHLFLLLWLLFSTAALLACLYYPLQYFSKSVPLLSVRLITGLLKNCLITILLSFSTAALLTCLYYLLQYFSKDAPLFSAGLVASLLKDCSITLAIFAIFPLVTLSPVCGQLFLFNSAFPFMSYLSLILLLFFSAAVLLVYLHCFLQYFSNGSSLSFFGLVAHLPTVSATPPLVTLTPVYQ